MNQSFYNFITLELTLALIVFQPLSTTSSYCQSLIRSCWVTVQPTCIISVQTRPRQGTQHNIIGLLYSSHVMKSPFWGIQFLHHCEFLPKSNTIFLRHAWNIPASHPFKQGYVLLLYYQTNLWHIQFCSYLELHQGPALPRVPSIALACQPGQEEVANLKGDLWEFEEF